MKPFFKKNKFYLLLLAAILLLALIIRINNLKNFDTSWADDGGAQLTYIETIYYENRLPTLDEIYLAWHEPAYYYLLAGWIKTGEFFGIRGLNWWESFNIVIYFIFLFLVWWLSYYYSKQNKWLALLNTFIYSIIFIGVKLSAYINNELLLHTVVLLLLVLFYSWQLTSSQKDKKIVYWSIVLAFACWVKITAWIILIAVILLWLIKLIVTRQKYFIKYIALVLLVTSTLNLPWIVYKQQHYNSYFSINIYDDKPRQNIFTSDGWDYILSINTHIFTDYPYWYSLPHSYVSVLLSDSFGNYYNLFHNCTRMEGLPDSEKFIVGNGQNTTSQLWQSLLNTNRWALLVVTIWWFGLLSWLWNKIKKRKIGDYDLFLLLVLFGGWSASLFHNLRLPYLEAGVLKAHFIYFTYPIMTLIAYGQWWKLLKKKVWWFIIAFIPWIVYLLIAWDILMIDYYV